MTPEELQAEILSKTAEYYRLVHAPKRDAPFVPGESRVNYAGRVFDEREMKNLVDASLDFWLTYGPWSRRFERELAAYLGVNRTALYRTVNKLKKVGRVAVAHGEIELLEDGSE